MSTHCVVGGAGRPDRELQCFAPGARDPGACCPDSCGESDVHGQGRVALPREPDDAGFSENQDGAISFEPVDAQLVAGGAAHLAPREGRLERGDVTQRCAHCGSAQSGADDGGRRGRARRRGDAEEDAKENQHRRRRGQRHPPQA